MKINRSDQRGAADFGWLKARYSFSFANYYNPENIHFGTLRVLNDDIVQPGNGFGTHPHENMEIITIPLEGALAHKDSTGGNGVIKTGQIQVMSAGKGVEHSEFNASDEDIVNLLQIWIFPNQKDVLPRYETIDYEVKENQFTPIVTPNKDDEGSWIYQDAWLSMGMFAKGQTVHYTKHNGQNGLFTFIIEGAVEVNEVQAHKRDTIEWQPSEAFKAKAIEPSKILQIEVPMQIKNQ